MKYAEFNVDTNKIEFLNSVFGIESVLLNGKNISNKFSFFGTNHNITLNSVDLTLESEYKQFDKGEILLELKENGKSLEKQTLLIDKKQRVYWLVIGLASGFGLFKLLDVII
ncbi:hypothetical protein [Gelidibacter gilvus]|uniref:Uncharacterized protein n=1 Tax=Gelidibacter gilvus TaxID=59602 RepID=A0A4Q0XI85_9FLAO|nr:hypothetical protein [Gelidibacter gilvus]RXJ49824.1 hypothetical protein ESZ48_10250 [Gelidibacter gilvus]